MAKGKAAKKMPPKMMKKKGTKKMAKPAMAGDKNALMARLTGKPL